MLIRTKNIIRQIACSEKEAVAMHERGEEPPIEELAMDVAFKTEDVRFIDECMPLGDSLTKSRFTIEAVGGVRTIYSRLTFDEAMDLVASQVN